MKYKKEREIGDYLDTLITDAASRFGVERTEVCRVLRSRLNSHIDVNGLKRLLRLQNDLDGQLSTEIRETQQRRLIWLSQLHYLQRWRRVGDVPMPSPVETGNLLDNLIRELRSLTRL